jgi:hypothetical protein
MAKVRFGNLIADHCTNDSANNGTFGLVATPGNHIAKHTACACANDCTNDAAIAIPSATIILRRGNDGGENSKCNTR